MCLVNICPLQKHNLTSAKISIKNINAGQVVCCWYEQQHK